MKRKSVALLVCLSVLCTSLLQAQNAHYANNRAPLKPTNYIKLPLGAVKPKGWLVIRVKARKIDNWKMDGASAGDVPLTPDAGANKEEVVELIPYGCTRLRISEFPLLGTSKK